MELMIPDEWFREEERDGFLVSEEMKRCWAAEIKMLLMIADVCERHSLTWYADFGTMLGAVRHGGFVPWDDDIDITMPRDDYNRLWPLLRAELPSYFQINHHHVKNSYYKVWGCIGNRQKIDLQDGDVIQEAITREFFGSPYAHVIDIFPLDHVAADEDKLEIQKLWYMMLYAILNHYDELEEDGELEDSVIALEQSTGLHFPREADKLKEALWHTESAVAAMYSREESIGYTRLSYWSFNGDVIRPFAWYDETVWLPFEMIKIPVPVGCKQLLAGLYGDWETRKPGMGTHHYPHFSDQKLLITANRLYREGRYAEEMAILEKGLEEFPGNGGMMILMNELKNQEKTGQFKE